MKRNFCCLIGLGAYRSSLGRQGAEQFVPTEAPHHGPGAATRRRGGTGGSNRGPAATTTAPPAIAQFVYRGIGDRTIFYRPASTFSFHLESIFLSPAELRKFDRRLKRLPKNHAQKWSKFSFGGSRCLRKEIDASRCSGPEQILKHP